VFRSSRRRSNRSDKYKKGDTVEIVLIDRFIVPEESKAKFLEEVRKSSAFLRTLPGFIEGFVYERTDGESGSNIVTRRYGKTKRQFRTRGRALPRNSKGSVSILRKSLKRSRSKWKEGFIVNHAISAQAHLRGPDRDRPWPDQACGRTSQCRGRSPRCARPTARIHSQYTGMANREMVASL
jgi:hypothetical protein